MSAHWPHVVYRCYDAADRLLYVGSTHDINARMQVHACSWNNPASVVLILRMTRYEVTKYADKATAREAERQAIYDEAPLLNVHHQRERITPAARRELIGDYLESTRSSIGAFPTHAASA